jgi:hypothetical protein
MSHAALRYVIDLKLAPNGEKISPAERATLCYLADRATDKESMAWPATAALAEFVGCTLATQRKVLSDLANKRILSIETKPRGQGRDGLAYAFIELQPKS